jgi:DNA-binding GntR family transcriptional regulator
LPLRFEPIEEQVYELLRKEIVTGTRLPGAQLRLSEVAGALGTSTMPVRGAVSRLKAEGLVVGRPRHGNVVAPLHLSDLIDIQTVRMGLEGIGARLGAASLEDASLERITKSFHRLEKVVQDEEFTLDEYLSLIREIHDVCYEAAGSPRLLELIKTFRAAAERYLRLAMRKPSAHVTDVQNQGRFVAACARRDGAGAEEATRALLSWTVEQVAPTLRPEGGGS